LSPRLIELFLIEPGEIFAEPDAGIVDENAQSAAPARSPKLRRPLVMTVAGVISATDWQWGRVPHCGGPRDRRS
jgi:hypothetical protein